MAKYNITALNYLASGSNRNFINMDIELDQDDYRLYDYVHLLAIEHKDWSGPVLSGDVLLERHREKYIRNDYLTYEFDLETILSSEYEDKCALSAISYGGNPRGILLRESSELYVENYSKQGQYIRLHLSCCTAAEREKLRKYIENSKRYGKIYEIELNQINSDTNLIQTPDITLQSIYDMDDVCIKSLNKETNFNIKNFDLESPTKTQDVYIPHDSTPISFAQVGDIAYLLTSKTPNGCDRLFSDIRRRNIESGGYRMGIENIRALTYLYPNYSQLSTLLDGNVSSYIKALNLYETTQALSTFGNIDLANYFRPKTNLDGIEYNYIAAAPVSEIQSEYRNGNVYADMYIAKNSYDSLYNMNMNESTTIQNCRNYTDIIQCGGQLYLKYYDNIDYTGDNLSNSTEMSSLLQTDSVHVIPNETGYPYQKIEAFSPVVIRGSSNKHKSTFFSVQIKDLDINNDTLDKTTQKLLNNIKFDITTSIKEIAENVCPAHTQLFDVYFGNTI